MEDMTKKSQQLSFVLYEEDKAPKHFNVSRPYLKFLLLGLPTISGLCALALIAGALYFKNLKQLSEERIPKQIETLKKEKVLLRTEMAKQSELITELQNKLVSKGREEIGPLDFFEQIPGQVDLTKSGPQNFDTQNVTTSFTAVGNQSGTLNFNFNLVNVTKNNKRLSGRIFVLASSSDNLYVYPSNSLSESQKMTLTYNKGESFATSRFRPVSAAFKNFPANQSEVLFKVIVFSNTGDLMFRKYFKQQIFRE